MPSAARQVLHKRSLATARGALEDERNCVRLVQQWVCTARRSSVLLKFYG